ncbi:MAG: hypothetical protein AAGJ73_05375 [Pseudomonadota bacterium]
MNGLVFTPVIIVLICFIAIVTLVTGVHLFERGVARVNKSLKGPDRLT